MELIHVESIVCRFAQEIFHLRLLVGVCRQQLDKPAVVWGLLKPALSGFQPLADEWCG